jgi:hypothetical protein
MNFSWKKNLRNAACNNLWAGLILLAGGNPAMAESIYPMISISILSIKRATIRLCKSWLLTKNLSRSYLCSCKAALFSKHDQVINISQFTGKLHKINSKPQNDEAPF